MARRAAVALLVAFACARPAFALNLQSPRLTRAEMEAVPDDPARLRVVWGTRDPAAAPLLRERARALAARLFGADSAQVVADRDVDERTLTGGAIVLVGGPEQNEWTRRLAPALPVEFVAHGFRWRGTPYERPGDVLALVWPSPLDPRRLLFLLAPNTPGALARHAPWLLGGDDWRITRDGELARRGAFAQGPGAAWRYDAALDRDREAERERWRLALASRAAAGVVVRAPAGLALAAPALAAARAQLARLDAMGLAARPARPVTLTLYRSYEEKAELTREGRAESLDEAGGAHACALAGRDAPDLWSVAAARLVALGASPRSRFLVPASAWLADREDGEAPAVALARLWFGRALPSAADAATRPLAWRSPLVTTPARALLARAVWECAGASTRRAALLALLRTDPPGTLDSLCAAAGVAPARVASRYRALADSLARTGRRVRAARAPVAWRASDGFARGVCLAHEVQLDRGYASAACARTLRTLQAAGARWVSLTAFGYVPPDGTPIVQPSAEGGPDEENDESIVEAAARAHALGLRVWLVPHLWSRQWPGAFTFRAADWPRFMAAVRELALHHALLADRERIEGLSVGHELASATTRDPLAWRGLIADVRGVYGGTLTYVANWDEVSRVAFWDALDLVAVSFYAPIANAPTRDAATLRAGATRALSSLAALARRVGRPVLLAEAGYPAAATAAVRPWEEPRTGADPESQRACYDALVSALDGADWVAGVLWWKWPSSGAAATAGEPSYEPVGRPAEAVLRRSLARWDGRPVRAPSHP